MTLLRMLAFRPDTAPRAGAASDGAAAARGALSRGGQNAAGLAAAGVAAAGHGAAGETSRIASPEPPREPEPAEPPAPPASQLRFTSIDAANWPAVVEAAALSGMVRQFALNCVPADFSDGVLTLKMDAQVADRRTRLIDERLQQGLSKHLGSELRLVFEHVVQDLASPARQRQLADQDKAARALAAFESDPAVKGLRERFGADIEAGTVKPAN